MFVKGGGGGDDDDDVEEEFDGARKVLLFS